MHDICSLRTIENSVYLLKCWIYFGNNRGDHWIDFERNQNPIIPTTLILLTSVSGCKTQYMHNLQWYTTTTYWRKYECNRSASTIDPCVSIAGLKRDTSPCIQKQSASSFHQILSAAAYCNSIVYNLVYSGKMPAHYKQHAKFYHW